MREDSRPKPGGRLVALALAVGALLGTSPALAADTPEPTWTAEQRNHWAFVPPRRPAVPQVAGQGWVRNPVDAFVLEQVEAAGIAPAPEADRPTLIRRLRFDLTGLPPSPEEVDAFVADPAEDAYERLVERLLASPQYGERWARHWLDLARFAESDGYKSDKPRPDAWRYRDWVVQALNEDLPYDRFLALQLAGDEAEPGDADAFVATGFNRAWPFEDNNMVPGLNRQLILDDMTDTTASVVLGLTVACARCHDHKYDPISQRDYYRFEAVFAAAEAVDDRPVAPPVEVSEYASIKAEHDARVDLVRREVEAIERPYALEILKDKLEKAPAELRRAFEADPAARSPEQEALLRKNAKMMAIEPKKMMAAMPPEVRDAWQGRRREMDRVERLAPPPLPTATGMADLGRIPTPVRLLQKGNFARPAEEVAPGLLSVFGLTELPASPGGPGTGRRRALAAWMTSRDNPLTARVIVNRLWVGHFGRGIVATASDFGTQGSLPTHPELLDWLACELMDRGWGLKATHRLIVTSAAYRQSSVPSARALEVDPDNALVSRMPRRRLEGEAVRDAILAASGELDGRVGGPSVFPDLPPGVDARGGWTRSPSEADRNRRSLYVFVKRNLKYPLFDAFDVPDTNLTCPERNVSVNAPQALMLLNSGLVLDSARALAGRAYAGVPDRDDAALVDRAYRLALARWPSADERARALAFLRDQSARLAGRGGDLALPRPIPEAVEPARAAALVDFCHALMNLNEFVYVD